MTSVAVVDRGGAAARFHLPSSSTVRPRWLAAPIVAVLLAACGPAGGPAPGSAEAVASASDVAPGPTAIIAPTAPTVVVSPVPASGPAASGVQRILAWTTVTPDTAVRARGGFEHAFLTSDRGAVILIRNLEAAATTLIAVTTDGSDWSVEEVPSADVPFGSTIDGGPDWLQAVDSADGGPPTLWASTDGRTWTVRGRLPEGIGHVGDAAVNGGTMVACSQAAEGLGTVCAASVDAGANWTRIPALDGLLGAASYRSMVPLGDGFILFREPETGEGIADVYVSPDGLDWSGGRVATIPSNAFSSATLGGRVFVVGADGTILSSDDGRTWASTPLPSRPDGVIAKLIRAGDALVALGEIQEPEGNALLTDAFVSGDGITWRTDTVPAQLRTMPDALTMSMAVPGGVLFPGDPAMVLARPVPAT